MKFTVLTLFPDMLEPLHSSMLGRAENNGIIGFDVRNIRDYSQDKHKKTDDTPFGGGNGMVMMADPLFRALRDAGVSEVSQREVDVIRNTSQESDIIQHAISYAGVSESAQNDVGTANSVMTTADVVSGKRLIYMSPRGRLLDGDLAKELSRENELVILCGHYEGVDQRVLDTFGAEEVSIGDYVLTGGEIPAMVLIDAVARMIPGVIAKEEAIMDESIYSGLLEYPQFTQPRSYDGLNVPEVLISGDHEKVRLWQFRESLVLTKARRPDLFDAYVKSHYEGLSKAERKIVDGIAGE